MHPCRILPYGFLTDVLEVGVRHQLHRLEVDLVVHQQLSVLAEPHVPQELHQISRAAYGRSRALSLPAGLPQTLGLPEKKNRHTRFFQVRAIKASKETYCK